MKRLIPLMLLLAVSSLALWVMLDGRAEAEAGLEPGPEPGTSNESSSRTRGQPLAGQGEDREKEAELRQRTPTTGPASRRTIIRGRCLDALAKRPLLGCSVRLESRRNKPSLGSLLTDGEGRFEFELEATATKLRSLTLRTSMQGKVDMMAFLSRIKPAQVLDLGDILLEDGTRLEARVTDEEGHPLSGIKIALNRSMMNVPTRVRPLNHVRATSGEDGSLDFGAWLSRGIWNIYPDEMVRLVRPRMVELKVGESLAQIEVIVTLPDPKSLISGTVVDEEGMPVASVNVQAKGEGRWPTGYGRSNREGAFVVRSYRPKQKPVFLEVPMAKGFEAFRSQTTYAWGSTDVVLTLQRAGGVLIEVVEAETEIPVEDFGVIWFQTAPQDWGPVSRSATKKDHHDGGIAHIEGIPEGETSLLVIPSSDHLCPSKLISFTKKSYEQPGIRVELCGRQDFKVQVLSLNGKPIAGTKLQLVKPLKEGPITLRSPVAGHDMIVFQMRRRSAGLLLSEATTNQEGRAVFRWHPSTQALTIRALGPGHIPMVEQGALLEEGEGTILVQVDTGATLVGSVGPLEVLELLGLGETKPASRPQAPFGQMMPGMNAGRGPGIVLRDATKRGGSQSPQGFQGYQGFQGVSGQPYGQRLRHLATDGSFRIEGIPSGTWDVLFKSTSSAWGVMYMGHGNEMQLGTVTLSTGETKKVSYDISGLRPATIKGQVFLNGKPAANRMVYLYRIVPDNRGWFRQRGRDTFQTDTQGAFETRTVRPGRYRLSLQVLGPGSGRQAVLACTDQLILGPGQHMEHTFQLSATTLVIEVLDATGKPVVQHQFTVRNMQAGAGHYGRTDAEGKLTIGPLSAGTYVVGTFRRPGDAGLGNVTQRPRPQPPQLIVLGEVVVSAGETVSRHSLRLPER